MKNIIKLGGVEFTPEELDYHYSKGQVCIIKYREILQIYKDGNIYKARSIYKHRGALPLTKRGRYFMWSIKNANELMNRG